MHIHYITFECGWCVFGQAGNPKCGSPPETPPIVTLLLHIHLYTLTPLTICHRDEPYGAVPHGTGPDQTELERGCPTLLSVSLTTYTSLIFD